MKHLGLYFFTTLFLFLNLSYGSSTTEKKSEITEIQSQLPPKKKRYRLKDKRRNYFRTDRRKFIKVEIPVTDRTIRVQDVKNISSDKINAILIWVKGRNTQTGCDVVKTRKRRIEIASVDGLDSQRLAKSKKLLVAIFNNDILLDSDIEQFKNLVKNAASYDDAVKELNMDNECARGGEYFEPRESGGDVIGGK